MIFQIDEKISLVKSKFFWAKGGTTTVQSA